MRTATLSLWLTIAAAALVATPAAGQPSVDVTFGRSLAPLSATDAPTTTVADSRQMTAGSVDLEHRVASAQMRLFYSLDAGTYNTPGDWSYYLHSAGGTWRSTKPDSTRPTLFIGGSAAWRANGASWAAADYRGLGAFANLDWRPRKTTTVRAGYRFDARTFPASPELNQREHGLFGSVLVNLPSRTTLIAEVRAGLKSYATGRDGIVVPVEVASTAPVSGGNGRGQGLGGAYRHPMTSTLPSDTSTPSSLDPARLVSVMGRISQSLADRTGISLQYTGRLSFGGLPTAIVTTPALFFEDGIYDDPFASNAHAWRGTLKQVLSNGAQLEGGGTWLLKDYRATPPLNPDGTPDMTGGTRADRIWRAGAAWTQPVLSGRTGPIGLNLVVDYWYTAHHSNDAFYNYTSHALGLGVSVSY